MTDSGVGYVKVIKVKRLDGTEIECVRVGGSGDGGIDCDWSPR